MHIFRAFVALAVAAVGLGAIASPASAQATRTWVSGVGDDANPCSRTAPCKTFAGAVSKTVASGEINCLDPGGFGAVTITKSLAIVCDGIGGGVVTGNGSGIVINAGDQDKVLLSGLDINGGGIGINGVRVLKAKSVVIRNSVIQGFSTPAGHAISVEGTAAVTLAGSAIVDNTMGLSGAVVSGGDNLLAGNDSDGQFASSKARK